MHIVWINDNTTLVGGCERYIQRTATLLKEQGVLNTLLYNVESIPCPKMLNGFAAAFPIVDLSRQLLELSPDIIYGHCVNDVNHWKRLAACGTPVLRFIHDHKLFCPREHKYTTLTQKTCTKCIGLQCYACLGVLNRTSSWPGIKLNRVGQLKTEQEICKQLDGVVVGSDYMASHIASHGFDSSKTHVLPLYALEPAETSTTSREEDLVLYVGQLTRGKGVDLLIKAIKKTSRFVRLLIAGHGPQASELQALRDRLGLTHRVHFIGNQTPEGLARLYKQATCVAVTSRSPETFCLVGVEAMSYGTPVIATDVGGVRQWLDEEVTGLIVPSGDTSMIAVALDYIVENPHYAQELGENSIASFRKNFLPKKHIENLLQLFSKSCKRGVAA